MMFTQSSFKRDTKVTIHHKDKIEAIAIARIAMVFDDQVYVAGVWYPKSGFAIVNGFYIRAVV